MRTYGVTAWMGIVLSLAVAVPLLRALPQSPPPRNATVANPFDDFFSKLATAQGVGGSRGETSYIKLMDSIEAMTPAEIAAGIPVIDRQIDSTAEPEDRLAKADAANLLMFISWRSDGAELLATQIDRLTSMLNDPTHLLSGPAVIALQHIALTRPDVSVPILEAALDKPGVNNSTSVGPGIATTLLRISPSNDEVLDHIVRYMRRQDLTDSQLVRTIVGIDGSPAIPDALTVELVRCLDRPNENVKSRALVGIAKSSPAAKDAARPRVQRLIEDPRESAHTKRLAEEALRGRITENPEIPN